MMKFRLARVYFIHIAIVFLLGMAVYSNTLDAPFQFDDSFNTIRNPYITDLSNIPAMFMGKKGAWASRPMLQSTIALNFHFGGFDSRGYHLLNTAVHILNGILLYMLIIMTGRRLAFDEDKIRLVALFSSALFVVHPAHTETVVSVVNRSMLFATSFYLLGMALFLKAVTAERRKGLYIAALLAASLLGMASREDFATFPLMLVAYDLFFVSRFKFREAAGHWKAYLPAFLSLGYMANLALNNTYDKVLSRGIPPVDYILTQFNVHWTYLRILVLPVNQDVDYDYRTADALLQFPTALSFVGYAGLWVAGVLLARKRPLASFPVLWFLIALFPISFAVALMDLRLGDVVFEHRLYLPSVAFFPAFVAGLIYAAQKIGLNRPLMAAAAVCVAATLVLSVAAYRRNVVWKSEVALWEDVVKKSPNKARPHYNYARALGRADREEEAIAQYRVAIAMDPRDPMAHFNVGVLYLWKGLIEAARNEFETTLQLDPRHPEAGKFLKYVSELENQ